LELDELDRLFGEKNFALNERRVRIEEDRFKQGQPTEQDLLGQQLQNYLAGAQVMQLVNPPRPTAEGNIVQPLIPGLLEALGLPEIFGQTGQAQTPQQQQIQQALLQRVPQR